MNESDRRKQMTAALDAMAEILAVDGATLHVERIDPEQLAVEASLTLDGVDCADCVLPPDRLRATIAASIEREVGAAVNLTLHDPRSAPAPTGVPSTPGGGDGAYLVLDPTGVAPAVGEIDAGPDAGPLDGKTVAIRHDVLWPSFDWTVDEWTRQLEAAGATVSTFVRAQGEKDDLLVAADAEWEALLSRADVAISGLGNCGSCTSWSVRDALTAASRGLATTVVATAHFEPLARLLASEGGRPGLRVTVLPYPYSTLDEETVREHARREFDQLVEVLGAAVAVAS